MDDLMALIYIFIFPGFIFLFAWAMAAQFMDRKLYARAQSRKGPGIMQPMADFIKLLAKEEVIPEKAEGVIFKWIPLASMAAALTAMLYMPMVPPGHNLSFQGDIVMILYLLTIPSLCMFLAGWFSRNRYGQIGGMRAMVQIISYEAPLVVSVMTAAVVAGSWNLAEIVDLQFTDHIWLVAILPISFAVSFIALQAKLERLPFDAPEAETEIIGGPLADYSGAPFAIFRLTRDLMLVAGASLMALVFLGGPDLFFDYSQYMPEYAAMGVGFVIFFIKAMLIIVGLSIFKSTVPRLRIDQLLGVSYWRLTPLALLQLLVVMGMLYAGWF